jgi:hypothetical protein
VPYFHVVFTLPMLAGEIAFQNKATVYAILFRAVAETLTTIAADPKHLGAQIGVTAVLHTWGQAGAGRRPLARRHALDRLPFRFLPARARALAQRRLSGSRVQRRMVLCSSSVRRLLPRLRRRAA